MQSVQEKLSEQVVIRMTPSERQKLEEMAKGADRSFGAIVRMLIDEALASRASREEHMPDAADEELLMAEFQTTTAELEKELLRIWREAIEKEPRLASLVVRLKPAKKAEDHPLKAASERVDAIARDVAKKRGAK